MVTKAITIVNRGRRTYAVSSDRALHNVIKIKLGVEDIMNIKNNQIPGTFEELEDGGLYTTNIPPVSDSSSSASPEEAKTTFKETTLSENDKERHRSGGDKAHSKPTKEAPTAIDDTNQTRDARDESKQTARNDSNLEASQGGAKTRKHKISSTNDSTRNQLVNHTSPPEPAMIQESTAKNERRGRGSTSHLKRKAPDGPASQAGSRRECASKKGAKRRKIRAEAVGKSSPSTKQKQRTPRASKKESKKEIGRQLRNAEGHFKRRSFEKALQVYRKALLIQESCYGKDDEDVASTYLSIGATLSSLGDNKAALNAYEEALRIQEAIFRGSSNGSSNETSIADTYAHIAEAHFELGDYDSVLKMYTKAQEINNRSKSRKLETAQVYNSMGLVHQYRSQYEKALEMYGKAQENYLALDGCEKETSEIYHSMGIIHHRRYDYKEAMESHQKALDILRRLGATDVDIANILGHLGCIFETIGKHKEAIEKYNEILSIQLRVPEIDPLEVAQTKICLGISWSSLEKHESALVMHREVLRLRWQSLEEGHSDIGQSHNDIGNLLEKLEKYDEAMKEYQAALCIAMDIDSKHTMVADTHNNIGCLFSRQGKHTKAMASFKNALKIQKESEGGCPLDIAKTYFNMGIVLENQGKYDNALEKYKAAHNIQSEKNHPIVADTLNCIGGIYRRQRKYYQALTAHNKALEILEKHFGDRHVDVGETYSLMGDLFAAQQRFEKAKKYYEGAISICSHVCDSGNDMLDELKGKLADIQNQV